MGTTVIIAEKADAARRISYMLSEGKSVSRRSGGLNYIEYGDANDRSLMIPLSGHIVELDFPEAFRDWSKSDLEQMIRSDLITKVKNRVAFSTLKKLSDSADMIIVATDYDREGELIGKEALDIIGISPESSRVRRAKFSALTSHEIKESFSNLINVDRYLADSAAAREEIDLIWGSVLTRFFSVTSGRLGNSFLSLGRVQTPTLALIVNREKEIRSFRPEKYWRILATFLKDREFEGELETGWVKSEIEAAKIVDELRGKSGTVESYSKENRPIYRPSPFNTTEFLREASRIGVAPARAMRVAESLYTSGYISYPRTDNTVYNRSIPLKAVLEKLKKSEFSREAEMVLSLDRISPSRGKTEATDHPPIYPVSVPSKGKLKGEFQKIYELVVRRFLATLYMNGTEENSSAKIKVGNRMFVCRGRKVIDPGWLMLYPYRKISESFLPELKAGEVIAVKAVRSEENETRPPARYDMGSIIKTMEDLRLGTKSTRHDILEKLQTRGFIEGNPIVPTGLGVALIEAVETVRSKISEPEMTAMLEDDMDGIALRKKSRDEVVNESREMLHSVLSDLKKNSGRIREIIIQGLSTGEKIGSCPAHGTDILMSRDRERIKIWCTTEGCQIRYDLTIRGKINPGKEKCSVCGKPTISIIRRGQSPEVKCIDPKCAFNLSRTEVGRCPSDGGTLVIRQSRYGKRFLGCSNYPGCTITYPLPQMGRIQPTGETCKYCGAPILQAIRGRRKWTFCPKIECEYNRKPGNKKSSRNTKKDGKAVTADKKDDRRGSSVGKKKVKKDEKAVS